MSWSTASTGRMDVHTGIGVEDEDIGCGTNALCVPGASDLLFGREEKPKLHSQYNSMYGT
jgi:hypothetical protein